VGHDVLVDLDVHVNVDLDVHVNVYVDNDHDNNHHDDDAGKRRMHARLLEAGSAFC
jgi:hypothetical protein